MATTNAPDLAPTVPAPTIYAAGAIPAKGKIKDVEAAQVAGANGDIQKTLTEMYRLRAYIMDASYTTIKRKMLRFAKDVLLIDVPKVTDTIPILVGLSKKGKGDWRNLAESAFSMNRFGGWSGSRRWRAA